MLYYLALAWNPSDVTKYEAARALLCRLLAAPTQWKIAVEQAGFVVCYLIFPGVDLDRPYFLCNRQGVVFGRLFEKDYIDKGDTNEIAPRPVVFDERLSSSILASAGKELTDRYWGQYVAFLRDTSSQKCWVLRDPAGGMPCQWTTIRGIDVYFVRLEDCERLGPGPFSVNRRYLLGYMTYGSISVRNTGLNEVETVLPGECIEHNADKRTRSFYWNPLKISEQNVVEDPIDAARQLRRTVRASVHAWASCFDGIALQLSGGLDSSIVASCLVDAPTRPRVLCRNLFSLDSGSDERFFARLVAKRAGFELIEQPAKIDFKFGSLDNAPKALSPFTWCISDRDAGLKDSRFLQSHGISAQFTGDGGDELFVTHSTLPGAADYAWRRGLDRQLISRALDDAIADKVSLWKVLRAVYHYGIRRRPWHMRNAFIPDTQPLLLPQIIEEARADSRLWHPLYADTRDVPRAKLGHAYLLTTGTTYCHLASDATEIPVISMGILKSQPVIELSLRIPMYILRADGQNRAMARRAFADDLPHEVIVRKTKAYGNSQLRAIIASNLSTVRDLLLNGFLVREGFLDKAKLESTLSGELSRLQTGILELATYLDVEAWIRTWDSSQRQAAA